MLKITGLATGLGILLLMLVWGSVIFPTTVIAQSGLPSSITPSPRPAQVGVATPGTDVGRAYSPNVRPANLPSDSSEYAILAYTATQNALDLTALADANATQRAVLATRRAVLEGDFATQSASILATATVLNNTLQLANAVATQQAGVSATQSASILATATVLNNTLQL
ncbi:MAG: hypothetical protein ACOYLB_15745, partial [Phototrophicaceae bacterium]